MEQFKEILNKPFVKEILAKGNLFFVGGCVRDHFLSNEPKDIDVVVQNIPFEQLSILLSIYGKVDLVGESFGVIKFKEFETGWECEIALPRIDKKLESFEGELEKILGDKEKTSDFLLKFNKLSLKPRKGHTAIIAQSDPYLSIEKDLKRRDFTINSIAFDHELNLIDPYNGLQDLKNKEIHPTNTDTFIDDPLRLLRAIVFSSRFSFNVSNFCIDLIQQHRHLINEITPERVLNEFQKVIDKDGCVWTFLSHLKYSGLFEEYFEIPISTIYTYEDTLNVNTMSELLLLMIQSESKIEEDWGTFFEQKLKIDTTTKKELNNFRKLYNQYFNKKRTFPHAIYEDRVVFFDCLKSTPWLFKSYFFNLPTINKEDFNSKYPKSLKEINIKGEDFLALGFEGQKIGELQRMIITAIMKGELINKKEDIIEFINKK